MGAATSAAKSEVAVRGQMGQGWCTQSGEQSSCCLPEREGQQASPARGKAAPPGARRGPWWGGSSFPVGLTGRGWPDWMRAVVALSGQHLHQRSAPHRCSPALRGYRPGAEAPTWGCVGGRGSSSAACAVCGVTGAPALGKPQLCSRGWWKLPPPRGPESGGRFPLCLRGLLQPAEHTKPWRCLRAGRAARH